VVLVLGLVADIWWVRVQWVRRPHAPARHPVWCLRWEPLHRPPKYKEHVGSYPVGSNAEIGKALMGRDP